VKGAQKMKKMVFLLSIILPIFLTCCEESYKSDINQDFFWLELTSEIEIVSIDCGHLMDVFIPISFSLRNSNLNDESEHQGHVHQVRISFFSADGGVNVPATFDQMVDYFVSTEMHQIFTIGIAKDEFLQLCGQKFETLGSLGYGPETGFSIFKGFIVIQCWGVTNNGINFEGEIQIPLEIIGAGTD
jgi:hypothetical protein